MRTNRSPDVRRDLPRPRKDPLTTSPALFRGYLPDASPPIKTDLRAQRIGRIVIRHVQCPQGRILHLFWAFVERRVAVAPKDVVAPASAHVVPGAPIILRRAVA